jgi:hypothetical protein
MIKVNAQLPLHESRWMTVDPNTEERICFFCKCDFSHRTEMGRSPKFYFIVNSESVLKIAMARLRLDASLTKEDALDALNFRVTCVQCFHAIKENHPPNQLHLTPKLMKERRQLFDFANAMPRAKVSHC